MYSAPFDYFRAGSIADATRLMKEHPGAKLLAGGHSLIPLLKMRLSAPTALVDIGRVAELRGLGASGGTIRIGALTTHAELAASPVLRTGCPMLAEAASHIGDQQVRNCGTIGGNIAHADPASDLPTVLLALGARIDVAGPGGRRTIAVDDFFRGLMTTAIGSDEILTDVEIAERKPGEGMAYAKLTHPASRYAVVGAAAVVVVKGGVCSAARVAIGGLLPAPARAKDVEKALVGNALSADVIERASAKVAASVGDEVLEDLYASAGYRRAMAAVYVKRALTTASARAV